jgi:hypothetical protein
MKHLMLTARTVDVGGTQLVSIHLNEILILRYEPGTSHHEDALEDAEIRIAQCLRSLFSVHFPAYTEAAATAQDFGPRTD